MVIPIRMRVIKTSTVYDECMIFSIKLLSWADFLLPRSLVTSKVSGGGFGGGVSFLKKRNQNVFDQGQIPTPILDTPCCLMNKSDTCSQCIMKVRKLLLWNYSLLCKRSFKGFHTNFNHKTTANGLALFPSPTLHVQRSYVSKKVKSESVSHSVVSDSLWSHGL